MRRAGVIVMLLAAAAALQAQEVSAPAEEKPATASELISSSLPQDIKTASYYELVSWCHEVGLDDSGTRKDLQSRLYAFYKITAEPEPARPARTISVKSAKESEYFTVEEADQKYISLTGNVVIVITDTDTGTVHEIQAQTLMYNQTLNVVTAKGGVEYSTTKNGTKETFTGESLTFDVNTLEGTFYGGRMVRPQKRSGQDVDFYFFGDAMSRTENDTVVMSDGGFTSCDQEESPHFQVRANRVWILAPGEWALENAVLFVGRVPVFYFPFFFYPGDEMFFNPSLGYDERKGEYLQTTTYLMGRKKKSQQDSSSFSFLQLQGDEGEYDLKLDGLFLRKIPGETAAAEKAGPTLKLLLDVYSRLGFFAGLTGDFAPLSTFQIGLAESRSVFQTAEGWLPYYIETDGTETVYWNQSSIFGLPVPFRFGMSGNLSASADFASVTSHFEYYSDPFFTQDFYARSEGMQFTSNLESLIAPGQSANQQSNLSWDVNSRFEFARLIKLPWIQTLSIPSLSLKFTWQSRETPSAPGSPLASDPGRYFYYPSSLVAPAVSLSVGGEILRYSSSTAAPQGSQAAPSASTAPAPAKPKPDPGKGFRTPLPLRTAETPKAEIKNAHLALRVPPRKKDDSVAVNATQNTVSLTYQVQDRATMEQSFDTKSWASQADVDFAVQYGTFDTGGSSQLACTASFLNRLVGGSLSLSADGNYRLHFNPAASLAPATWRGLLLGDMQQDKFALKSTLQVSLNPFVNVPVLSSTTAAYKLGLKLYSFSLTGTDPFNPVAVSLGPGWDQASVVEHSLSASLSLKTGEDTQSLSLTAQLPPRAPSVSGSLDFSFWLLRTHIQTGMAMPLSTWEVNPLVVKESLNVSKDITASEELQFDLNEPALDKAASQLKLWGFAASFGLQRMLPTDGLGVPIGTVKELLPASLRLGYEYTASPIWLWKNRIKLDGSVKTGWNQNLQKYTENSLDFSLSLNASIFKFLDFSFSSVSYNNKMYRYIPGWPEAFGEPSVNPVWDLIRSFNFFSLSDRYATAFKLRSISLKAIWHLHDWDVSFEYQGSPKLVTLQPSGVRQYEWTPVFAIQVKWIAIPEVNSRLHQDTLGDFYIRN